MRSKLELRDRLTEDLASYLKSSFRNISVPARLHRPDPGDYIRSLYLRNL